MGTNIGKNISENLSRKYSQKLLDHTKQSATDVFKTASKRVIHENNRSSWWFHLQKLRKKYFRESYKWER